MGWYALPSYVIVSAAWAAGFWAIDTYQIYKEGKPSWNQNKDQFQRALYRRDWYLRREQETIGMFLGFDYGA
uniref:MWFE n=1 Tax=Polytomella sp. Pringsheim 198.80 TaxID=37502 RepID=UPI001E1E23EF|nr:Chain a, MWFE [Polytomella sp. Pringsheim 198.80]7ARD_a Chain a, MWFE [Polytomella sp. Pringsheim 198.80]